MCILESARKSARKQSKFINIAMKETKLSFPRNARLCMILASMFTSKFALELSFLIHVRLSRSYASLTNFFKTMEAYLCISHVSDLSDALTFGALLTLEGLPFPGLVKPER